MPLLFRVLLAQFLALGLTLLLARWLVLGPWWFWTEGLIAASFSALFALPPWWWLIQGLFLPLAMLLLDAGLNPLWYLLVLVFLLLLLPGAVRDRVPLYLSSQQTIESLTRLLPLEEPGGRFLDLGCGGGHLLMGLAKARPDMVFHGMESSPLLFLLAYVRTHSLANCQVRWGSFWTMDLSGYDLVYAFLSPAPMERLWQLASTTMKPGSSLISNSFVIPGQKPDERHALDNGPETELLLWYIKKPAV